MAAVKAGLIQESAIDIAVKRLFTARFGLGLFDPPARVAYAHIPFAENDSAAHRALALDVARKALVLLKNDHGVLPLSKDIRTIAVIGPSGRASGTGRQLQCCAVSSGAAARRSRTGIRRAGQTFLRARLTLR